MDLLVERPGDGVAVVTINRPERHNAITIDLQRRLDRELTTLEDGGDVRAVVLTGAGDAAFSAGYDVHEMAAWSADELAGSLREREPWIWHLATTELPLVAALNGITYGAGAIIATCADIRIASSSTVFRFTAARYGGANATWSLPSLVGRGRASELLMTARAVGAPEAERIGLVNRVVPDGQLLEAALDVAGQIAANPAAGVRAIKRLLREHQASPVRDRYEAETEAKQTELAPKPVAELYKDFLS
jgi:enoyl-CoA hydratase/carnithine racemase